MDSHDPEHMLTADVRVVPILEGGASLGAVWMGVDTSEISLRCGGHRTYHIRDIRFDFIGGGFLFDPAEVVDDDAVPLHSTPKCMHQLIRVGRESLLPEFPQQLLVDHHPDDHCWARTWKL